MLSSRGTYKTSLKDCNLSVTNFGDDETKKENRLKKESITQSLFKHDTLP